MTRFHFIILLIYLGCSAVLAQERSSSAIRLIYTGNLNCALDDCQCGDKTVGGLTRILTALDSLRQKYPDLILVDGGDFLNSYPLPQANQLMLSLLSRARFTALNMGDQEFVQGTDFPFDTRRNFNLNLPLLCSNITGWNSRNFLAVQMINVENRGTAVTIMGVVSPDAFEFISPEPLNILSPAETLENLQTLVDTSSGLQILLFHGRPAEAEKLAEKFPWLDVIVLSHNQEMRFARKKRTAFVESASEGEYIGHLEIRQKDSSWEFENEFIPIYESIPPDPEAKRQVNEYRRKLRKSQKQGTTSH